MSADFTTEYTTVVEPKFSVVVSIYNKAPYLYRSFGSILRQSVSDLDVIAIDAGSTDGGLEYLVNLSGKDARIRVIEQTNQGISAARNLGVQLAYSEYIAFIDADDEWDLEFLAEVMLMRKQFPSASAYATGFNIVNNSVNSPVIYTSNNQREVVTDYFRRRLEDWGIHISSVVVKKSMFEAVGGFPRLIASSDARCCWILDCEGNICQEYPYIVATGRLVALSPNDQSIDRTLHKFEDLQVELPGPKSEDQYLLDGIALRGQFAYSNKILASWHQGIVGQTSVRSDYSKIFPHFIQIVNAIQCVEIGAYSNKLDLVKYARYLSVGLLWEIKHLDPIQRHRLYNIYRYKLVWRSNVEVIIFIKLLVWRARRKFSHLLGLCNKLRLRLLVRGS